MSTIAWRSLRADVVADHGGEPNRGVVNPGGRHRREVLQIVDQDFHVAAAERIARHHVVEDPVYWGLFRAGWRAPPLCPCMPVETAAGRDAPESAIATAGDISAPTIGL